MNTKIVLAAAVVALVTLVTAQNSGKPGDCPPPTAVDVCDFVCWGDRECPGASKCCPTACGGAVCTRPVSMRAIQAIRVKPGYCPERPTGPWVCSSRCSIDGDCRGSQKCCKNRCGAMACMKPEI